MSRFRALLICNSYRDRQHEHTLGELPDALSDGADVKEWLWGQLQERPGSAHVITNVSDLHASAMINEIKSLGNDLQRMEHKPLVWPAQSPCVSIHQGIHNFLAVKSVLQQTCWSS
jgi:hypothetical protein